MELDEQLEVDDLPEGWPSECGNCGAPGTEIGFDYALGFNCSNCGAMDADEFPPEDVETFRTVSDAAA